MQRLSQWAALRCRDPLFQEFLGVKTEVSAAHVVRRRCKVESRGDLDRDPEAAQRFHELIRLPFSRFNDNHH